MLVECENIDFVLEWTSNKITRKHRKVLAFVSGSACFYRIPSQLLSPPPPPSFSVLFSCITRVWSHVVGWIDTWFCCIRYRLILIFICSWNNWWPIRSSSDQNRVLNSVVVWYQFSNSRQERYWCQSNSKVELHVFVSNHSLFDSETAETPFGSITECLI